MTQAEALSILKTGANVFLTGEPGSGKTHTLNQYVLYLQSCGIEPAVTASTGIAATHIGGMTIHSWSGIGIRDSLSDYDLDFITQNKNLIKRVQGARVLIIDEISMLSARVLNMVDIVCREVKRVDKPFGGLQVILVGDFFQLPPINKREDGENIDKFAFCSSVWSELRPIVCYLSEQHRQEDEDFLSVLNAIRSNEVEELHREILEGRFVSSPKKGITKLYSHNIHVDEINNKELEKLSGENVVFKMQEKGPDKLVTALKKGCLSPELLSLKIGARVMFTKNDFIKRQYVNGTIGVVTQFVSGTNYPIVKTEDGRTVFVEPSEWHIEDSGRILARINQIPLRLAWAITVHKSQGMSLDSAHMDLTETFEYGQGYVALSRVRTLSGLFLAGFNRRALEVHPEIIEKDIEFKELSEGARERFAKISPEDLYKMHENFVLGCGGSFGKGKKKSDLKKVVGTLDATRELLKEKLSLKEMAYKRQVTVGTIVSHLEKLLEEKKIIPIKHLSHLILKPKRFNEIKKAFTKVYKEEKKMLLNPVKEILGESYSFEEIRIARLFVEK